jgi:DNA-binding MarR family transcriptional regulator
MFHESIKVFPQFIKKVLREHDISKLNLDINSTQTKILMFVYESNDKSMSEISSMAGLEKSSFTRSVDYLVNNGFLLKNSPENDRRIINLSLTDKGIKAAKLIKCELDIYLDSLISDFPDKEKEEFLKALNTVTKYVNKMLECNKKLNSIKN